MGMSYNPYTLVGKTILVTGASSGIGRGAAIECAKMGAKVIITARNEERLQDTLAQLEGEGHEMRVCDLADNDAIKTMVDTLPEVQGVVNNAGFTTIQPIQFINEDAFRDIMQVNTMAPVLILKYLLKKKKLKAGASVVFTSSLAGIGKMSVGNTMYGCSKGAISAFIQGAAKELATKRIRVNAVCPGLVESQILASGTIADEQLEKLMELYPLGRAGKPEDVAWAMVYLLSDASSWITGVNLPVDGGRELY
jgi:NAD(P)-dependent dehydrogenase (short-subunit alcohol dehydrogenase family)